MVICSWPSASILIVSYLEQAIDETKAVYAIYTDMIKAFDFVHHMILHQKLHDFGTREKIHKHLESYPIRTIQCTEIYRVYTKTIILLTFLSRMTKCRVPQGIVLGPLLVLLYINDLLKAEKQILSTNTDGLNLLIVITNLTEIL